jgi:hypothetical protein
MKKLFITTMLLLVTNFAFAAEVSNSNAYSIASSADIIALTHKHMQNLPEPAIRDVQGTTTNFTAVSSCMSFDEKTSAKLANNSSLNLIADVEFLVTFISIETPIKSSSAAIITAAIKLSGLHTEKSYNLTVRLAPENVTVHSIAECNHIQ